MDNDNNKFALDSDDEMDIVEEEIEEETEEKTPAAQTPIETQLTETQLSPETRAREEEDMPETEEDADDHELKSETEPEPVPVPVPGPKSEPLTKAHRPHRIPKRLQSAGRNRFSVVRTFRPRRMRRALLRNGALRVNASAPVATAYLTNAIVMELAHVAAATTAHARRKTVSVRDVQYALNRCFGMRVYGE